MPRGNGTGPMGMGPRTGRGTGYCAGDKMPGFMNNLTGFGYCQGRGQGWFGRDFRAMAGRWAQPCGPAYNTAPMYYGYPYQPSAETEKELLVNEAEALKEQLGFLEKRISELESKEK